MSVFAPMQIQTYDNLWKRTGVLERKGSAQVSYFEAVKIYDKAKAEQNVPQMMKTISLPCSTVPLQLPDGLKVDMNGLRTMGFQTGSMENKLYCIPFWVKMTMPETRKS